MDIVRVQGSASAILATWEQLVVSFVHQIDTERCAQSFVNVETINGKFMVVAIDETFPNR
jgi:hypothetical protein